MFCPNCGSRVNDDAAFCPNCGNSIKSAAANQTAATANANADPFDTPPASQQQAPVQQQYQPQQSQQAPTQQQNVNTENTIAIVGFVLSLIGGGVISLILSIMGYQNAQKGAKYKNLAVAGIVISAISLAFEVIGFIAMLSSGLGMLGAIFDGAWEEEFLVLAML